MINAASGPAGAINKDVKDKDGKTQDQRLRELKFAAHELEEDLETRDFVPHAKITQTVNIKHSSYACSGTETTHK